MKRVNIVILIVLLTLLSACGSGNTIKNYNRNLKTALKVTGYECYFEECVYMVEEETGTYVYGYETYEHYFVISYYPDTGSEYEVAEYFYVINMEDGESGIVYAYDYFDENNQRIPERSVYDDLDYNIFTEVTTCDAGDMVTCEELETMMNTFLDHINQMLIQAGYSLEQLEPVH